MIENQYEAPKAELSEAVEIGEPTSRVEQLKAAREEYQRQRSLEALRILWILKMLLEFIGLATMIYFAVERDMLQDAVFYVGNLNYLGIAAVLLPFGFYLGQVFAFVALCQRKRWSVWVLNVFAFFSLLQFPVGTAFAVFHFVKARGLRFQ